MPRIGSTTPGGFARAAVLHASVAGVYCLVGEFSERFATQAADISAFWPPAGIGLACAMLFGVRVLPAVGLGAFIGNFFDIAKPFELVAEPVTASLLLLALVDGVLAIGEAALAWMFVARVGGGSDPFRRVRHVAAFIGGSAVLAPMLTAGVGVTLLNLAGELASAGPVKVWLTWVTGDCVGILVFTPAIVAWRTRVRAETLLAWLAELAAVISVIALIAVPVAFDYPLEYLVLLPLVWASFRLGIHGSSVAVVCVAIASISLGVGEQGYFARFSPTLTALLVQSFVGCVAVLPLVLIPALIERHESAAQRARLRQDLLIAQSIQRSLLPSDPPDVPGFEIAGWSRPADETGGDYYDWIHLPRDELVITLGDVTGHGIGPALVTAACHAYVRAIARDAPDPGPLLTRLNTLLCEDMPGDRFITLAAVRVSADSPVVRLRSAGQGPVLVYRASTGQVERRPADDPPLGVIEGHAYGDAVNLELADGDMVILITDGFFEWPNAEGELYGVERLCASLAQAAAEDPSDVISSLASAVRRHVGDTPQPDDLTAVVIRRKRP